jgi:2-oxoglutarate dehydrogenase E2 component (dihydrolipoamide succinyltransferase)
LTQKELNQKVLISQKVLPEAAPAAPVAEAPKAAAAPAPTPAAAPAATYASGTPSQLQEKF